MQKKVPLLHSGDIIIIAECLLTRYRKPAPVALPTPAASLRNRGHRDLERSDALSSRPLFGGPWAPRAGCLRSPPTGQPCTPLLASCQSACCGSSPSFQPCSSAAPRPGSQGQVVLPVDLLVCRCCFTFGFNEGKVGGCSPCFWYPRSGRQLVRCLGLRHGRAVLSGMEVAGERALGPSQ